MASPGFYDAQALIAKVKILINAQLKSVLKKEGLAVSGVKAAMQDRIITQIENYVRQGNIDGYTRIRATINNPNGSVPPTSANHHVYQPNPTVPANQNQFLIANGLPNPTVPSMPTMPTQTYGVAQLNFKNSPFYSIIEPLTPVLECKGSVRETTRDQLNSKIILRAETANMLNNDPTLRVMIYCASEPIHPFVRVDISFPHQVEIKINLDEVKANLRGLKNKPGSTRPADITHLLRKREGYENSMTVTYALTHKKFYLIVNLVRQYSTEALVSKLRSGNTISIERVVREMISKAEDNELVATSTVMSLKCPLSTLRINVPCRSTVCTHNQCFDALSFLQLQEQAPTWTCPLCNKIISFEALEVDQYVSDILEKTSKSVEQVTIEPNGKWSQISESNSSPKHPGDQKVTGDNELIEINDVPRITQARNENSFITKVQPHPQREQSVLAPTALPSSGKRSIGQVVDLTISSDDDDDPPRAPKRQFTVPAPRRLSSVPSSESIRTKMNPGSVGRKSLAASSHVPRNYEEPR